MAAATASSSSSRSSRRQTSIFTAPQWVHDIYSKFPLVVLEQEDELPWRITARQSSVEACLWVHPPSSTANPHYRPWASADPDSLRTQLLFLLRKAPVSFRTWHNQQSAPGSRLPALHLRSEERIVSADDIRAWLDQTCPLKGKQKELQNMPSQEAYDKGIALAHLVLGPLHTALMSTSSPLRHKSIPNPPPLAAGLKTPLPAALTGDDRSLDQEEIVEKGSDALEAIAGQIEDGGWALRATSPTPLDALLAAHIYSVYDTNAASDLRRKADTLPGLADYLDRVLTYAGSSVHE